MVGATMNRLLQPIRRKCKVAKFNVWLTMSSNKITFQDVAATAFLAPSWSSWPSQNHKLKFPNDACKHEQLQTVFALTEQDKRNDVPGLPYVKKRMPYLYFKHEQIKRGNRLLLLLNPSEVAKIFHSNHEFWLILLGAFYENNAGSDQKLHNCFNRTIMHFHLLPISM